jgi:chromosome partitioning protein
MHIIAFVTQKGGTGKSTVAASLAVAALEAGEQVAILDMDPQQSLATWYGRRGRDDMAVHVCRPESLDLMLDELRSAGVSLCLIDTEGTASATAVAAMEVADLCVIPVRPNAFDLWASEATRRKVRELGRDSVFLLNQCPPLHQGARVKAGIEALEAAGALLSPIIVSRVDYQDAGRRGAGVTEINRCGSAAEEMRMLWRSLVRRLTGVPEPVASEPAELVLMH